MRILSQDGLHEGIIDVSYEQVSIEQKGNEIWCGYSSAMDRHCVGKCFAEYSTEAKARKAMEMLQKAYSPILVIKEQEDGIKPNIRPNDWLLTPALPTQKVEVIDNFYFQFPADDEVEVSQ